MGFAAENEGFEAGDPLEAIGARIPAPPKPKKEKKAKAKKGEKVEKAKVSDEQAAADNAKLDKKLEQDGPSA